MAKAVVFRADWVPHEEMDRLAAIVAATPWFQRGFFLVHNVMKGKPVRWVWLLPPAEAHGAALIFGIPVKVIEGVEPHLAIELPSV